MAAKDMNELDATELRLGLPGTTEEDSENQNQTRHNKRSLLHAEDDDLTADPNHSAQQPSK